MSFYMKILSRFIIDTSMTWYMDYFIIRKLILKQTKEDKDVDSISNCPLCLSTSSYTGCVCVCVCVCPHLRDFPSLAHGSLLLGHPPVPTYPTQPPFPSQLGVKKKLLGHSIDHVPWSSWPMMSASAIIQRTSCQPTGQDSAFPTQGARVQSLVRELDPTCHNEEACRPPVKTQHSQNK